MLRTRTLAGMLLMLLHAGLAVADDSRDSDRPSAPGLHPLDDDSAIMHYDGGLYRLDLRTTEARRIGSADRVAVNAASQVVLAVERLDEGCELIWYRIEGERLHEVLRQQAPFAAHAMPVNWGPARFYVAGPVERKAENSLIIWPARFVSLEESGEWLETSPVSGLSDVTYLPLSVILSPIEGTLAYSGHISHPELVLDRPSMPVLDDDSLQGFAWLVTVIDGQPHRADSIRTAASARPLAFSEDGRRLLVRAGFLDEEKRSWSFAMMDLETLEWSPVDLPASVELLAVDGELSEAIGIMGYQKAQALAEEDAAFWREMEREMEQVFGEDAEPRPHPLEGEAEGWHVVLVRPGERPRSVQRFDAYPRVSAFQSGGVFFMSDGRQLWRVDQGELVEGMIRIVD